LRIAAGQSRGLWKREVRVKSSFIQTSCAFRNQMQGARGIDLLIEKRSRLRQIEKKKKTKTGKGEGVTTCMHENETRASDLDAANAAKLLLRVLHRAGSLGSGRRWRK